VNTRAIRDITHAFGTGLAPVGTAIVFVLLVVSLWPDLVATYDPFAVEVDRQLLPPSPTHFFGTDELGRDLFARVVHGTRISVGSALVVVLASAAIGTTVGFIAGFARGAVDQILMRIADVFIAFPGLIIAMAIVSILGPSLQNAMAAIVIIWWPQYARLARAQVLVERSKLYVEAAISMGARATRILIRHVAPNAWVPLVVKGSLDLGLAMLLTASLSFLGLGALPPSPELGALITRGRDYLLNAWWYSTFPGLVMFVAVLGFNLLGDSFRDAFDPTLRDA
jgi:peptide/nickel transport system permease protein